MRELNARAAHMIHIASRSERGARELWAVARRVLPLAHAAVVAASSTTTIPCVLGKPVLVPSVPLGQPTASSSMVQVAATLVPVAQHIGWDHPAGNTSAAVAVSGGAAGSPGGARRGSNSSHGSGRPCGSSGVPVPVPVPALAGKTKRGTKKFIRTAGFIDGSASSAPAVVVVVVQPPLEEVWLSMADVQAAATTCIEGAITAALADSL